MFVCIVLFEVCREFGVVRRSVLVARLLLHVYACLPFVVCRLSFMRFLWVSFFFLSFCVLFVSVMCAVCYVLLALAVCFVLFVMCCTLCFVRCVLFLVRCSLFVVRCVLLLFFVCVIR